MAADPKPRRYKSEAALIRYHLDHPWCEVEGCRQWAMPTPHHLRPRSLGGSDVAENLLSLDWNHHIGPEGWHVLGPRTWYERFRERLSPENRAKIEARL